MSVRVFVAAAVFLALTTAGGCAAIDDVLAGVD